MRKLSLEKNFLTCAGLIPVVAAACLALRMNDPASATNNSDSWASAKNTQAFIFAGKPETDYMPTHIVGSGFVVSIPCEKKQIKGTLKFLITCKHVVEKRTSVRLRFNTKPAVNSESVLVEFKSQGGAKNILLASDPAIDLAAIYLNTIPKNAELRPLELAEIISESEWSSKNIEEGTEVFTVGPVFGYPGKSRNMAAVRIGRIALINSDNWYKERVEKIFEKAFLTDINITHGTSGSPVFLLAKANATSDPNKAVAYTYTNSLSLLGVIKGAPDVTAGQIANSGPSIDVPQAVSACEPASSLRIFLREIAKEMVQQGFQLSPENQRLLNRV